MTKFKGHAESYNPPPEYLPTEEERNRWDKQSDEPYKRKMNFLPKKFDCLRKVPAYEKFIHERFERCLDLYLAPRARKMRLTIQPEDLVPQLPKPQDLQPFPQVCSVTFKGHKNMVRTLSIEPKGQFLASGSDDGTVKLWEVQTGYCFKTFVFGKTIIHRDEMILHQESTIHKNVFLLEYWVSQFKARYSLIFYGNFFQENICPF